MPASQETIARQLGICRSTVSLALREDPRISAAVRERVRTTAEKLGYRPNRLARAIRTGRSGLIGVIQNESVSQLAAQRTCALNREIYRNGYHPLLADMLLSPAAARAACAIMTETRVEGVVLIAPGAWFPEQEWEGLLRTGIPIVSLSGMRLSGVPHVCADARQGMRELTAHLLGQGRRRLLFWSRWWSESRDSEINWAMTERIAGFRDAVLAAGGILREGEDPRALARASRTASARPEGWIYFVGQSELDEADNCRDGRDVAVALLQAGCRPDAILCSNDERALGALTALTEAGVRIPEDMAVTGYDGIPYAAYGAIPLTTVEQPLEAMARHAADLLVRMLGGDRPAAAELRVQIPGRLAVRASSTGTTVAPQAEASAGGMRVAV